MENISVGPRGSGLELCIVLSWVFVCPRDKHMMKGLVKTSFFCSSSVFMDIVNVSTELLATQRLITPSQECVCTYNNNMGCKI